MTEPTPEPTPAPTPTPDVAVEPTPAVAEAIVSQLGDTGLTAEQITQVLGAYNQVRAGDPPGTIVRDPNTGTVAHRVVSEGVHVWRCSAPDGTQWSDMTPTLPGWETIVSPSA